MKFQLALSDAQGIADSLKIQNVQQGEERFKLIFNKYVVGRSMVWVEIDTDTGQARVVPAAEDPPESFR